MAILYRYNFDRLCKKGLKKDTYISPQKFESPHLARRYLALLYTPGWRYEIECDPDRDLKDMDDGCPTNKKFRRVWAAFGEPGGGFESQIGCDSIGVREKEQLAFGGVARELSFVEEPWHILLSRDAAKKLMFQFVQNAKERGLLDKDQDEEAGVAPRETGVVYHFKKPLATLNGQTLYLEFTVSFAPRKRGRSYWEAISFWGMGWVDLKSNCDAPASCTNAGFRLLLPVVSEKIEGMSNFEVCPEDLSSSAENGKKALLLTHLLDVLARLKFHMDAFTECWAYCPPLPGFRRCVWWSCFPLEQLPQTF